MNILQTSSTNKAQYNHMYQGIDNIVVNVYQIFKKLDKPGDAKLACSTPWQQEAENKWSATSLILHAICRNNLNFIGN
jgi:hypothetical protein